MESDDKCFTVITVKRIYARDEREARDKNYYGRTWNEKDTITIIEDKNG